jgi:hypothetical protein
MSEVWALDDLESTDKFVLLALADNANDQRMCWPSIQTIAKKTSLSERAVHYSIKRLEEAWFLTVYKREGRSNMFRLGCPDIGGAPNAPLPSDAPPEVHVVHPTPARGAPRTIKESSFEPSEIFRMLLKTSGREPKRTNRIQAAIDKIGGWVKIRNVTDLEYRDAERAFTEAYLEVKTETA